MLSFLLSALLFPFRMNKVLNSIMDTLLSSVGLRRRKTKSDIEYASAVEKIIQGLGEGEGGSGNKPIDDGDANEDAGILHRIAFKLNLAKAYLPYPQDDPFYAVYSLVGALDNVKPGTILRTRSIKIKDFPGLSADKLQAWEIAYATEDQHGNKQTTVMTVIKPPNARKDFLLGYCPKTDASIPNCRTTYALREGTAARFGSLSETIFFESFLDQNWILFVPDYQGQHDAFGSGPIAGRCVLDATRAVLSFSEPLGLSENPRIAYNGYSSGALACAWTAQLQTAYAPDLTTQIIGYAFGGCPVDIHKVAYHVQGSIAAGLTLGVVVGLGNVHPDLRQFVYSSLTKEGSKLYGLPTKKCFAGFMLPGLRKNVLSREYWKIDDPLEQHVPRRVLDELALGKDSIQAPPPSSPLHIMQSLKDEVVPIDQVDALVETWTRQGASIEYVRDEFPGHVALCFTGLPSTLRWLKERVDGSKEPESKPGQASIKNVKSSLFIKDDDTAKEHLSPQRQNQLQATLDLFKDKPWFM